VFAKTARASRSRSRPKYRGETCVRASIRTPASRATSVRLGRGRVQRLGGAIDLLLEERRLVDEQIRTLCEHAHDLRRRRCHRGTRSSGRGAAGRARRRA
jgi:hypothetical protein